MSDLSIIIRAILEKSTKQQIEQELKIIEQKLKPLEIKIDKKALEVLQALVEVNKKISSGIEQATSKLNEQTKHIQNEKLEVNKLSDAYGELGKKIKTVQTLDANKTPTTRTETYKNLAGVETTVRTAGSKETGYTVVTKDKSIQQEQLELEKRIGGIQSKNFNEAKQHLTQLNKLRQDYYKLGNKDTEEAQELRKQLSYHQGQYNNIIRRKIDIGEKTKIEGVEEEKLIQLEKIREQTLRNINNIKAKNTDKSNAQQQKQVDDFNKKNINAIDHEIQKREIQGQQFSKALQAKMLQGVEEKKITSEIHKQSLAQQDLLNRIRGMRGVDGKFIVGDNLSALNTLESQIRGFDPTNKNFSKNMAEANSKLREISTTTSIYKKEIQDANKYTGLFGQSIFEAGKKFSSWLFIGNIIIGFTTSIKTGIQSIIDIDTAITNLNKVTDETRETLNKFSLEANAIGRELAKTTVEVIDSTTEFARLGYSLEQSAQLAKQALLYSNVGDIGVEQASLAIISAVKGFGVAVDEEGRNIQKIVDIYNEVGNNFAISSAGIGEAMRRSAASLYAAGNTMEEAVALITAANSVVQDPAMVGTACF